MDSMNQPLTPAKGTKHRKYFNLTPLCGLRPVHTARERHNFHYFGAIAVCRHEWQNGKNGYHGDQLGSSHCDGNGIYGND